ncbi:hypothetical protein [Methanolobus profundi]|uniref:Uncharacterized protein n=1 Tax=Methanolobus profundi TaxID=487685 RepID=A0A1I4UNP4_9EURY|nr:hypothetical protein [Methanolobus profundi]SFM90604.1 hypothetical protein SAMN04488696_2813 [Methanolobus profundi]
MENAHKMFVSHAGILISGILIVIGIYFGNAVVGTIGYIFMLLMVILNQICAKNLRHCTTDTDKANVEDKKDADVKIKSDSSNATPSVISKLPAPVVISKKYPTAIRTRSGPGTRNVFFANIGTDYKETPDYYHIEEREKKNKHEEDDFTRNMYI